MQTMNLFGIRWVTSAIGMGVQLPFDCPVGQPPSFAGWCMHSRIPETIATPIVPLLSDKPAGDVYVPSQYTENIIFTGHDGRAVDR